MDWHLEIAFHWPHDRMALGWECIKPDEENNIIPSSCICYL